MSNAVCYQSEGIIAGKSQCASKWGPGSEASPTTEPEVPKAPHEKRSARGRDESPALPQNDRSSKSPRDDDNRRRQRNNKNNRNALDEGITRDVLQPYTRDDFAPPTGPRNDRRPAERQPEPLQRLGNGIDHGYARSAKAQVEPYTSRPLTEHITREPHSDAYAQFADPSSRRDNQISGSEPAVAHRAQTTTGHDHGLQKFPFGHGRTLPPNTTSQHRFDAASGRGTVNPLAHVLMGQGRGHFSKGTSQMSCSIIENNTPHGEPNASRVDPASCGTVVNRSIGQVHDQPAPSAANLAVQPADTSATGVRLKRSTVKKVVSFSTPPTTQVIESPAEGVAEPARSLPTFELSKQAMPELASSTSVLAKSHVSHAIPAMAPIPVPAPASRTSHIPAAPSPSVGSSSTAVFHIPFQGTLSDTDFHFLLSKLQGREISVAEWDTAVQQIQNFDFGTSFSAQVQTTPATAALAPAPSNEEPHPLGAEDPAAPDRELQPGSAELLKAKEAERFAKDFEHAAKKAAKDAERRARDMECSAYTSGRSEDEVVEQDKNHDEDADVWSEMKEKLSMLDLGKLNQVGQSAGLSATQKALLALGEMDDDEEL
ncbi:hypothetical protein EK21DRAFT_92178 [Setomelanomma holmii]|uniref:Uncharacterized protein n=1 Tax=Setomelanomma holmii TaxID=210430 RepID=A0A9P4LHF1_9PLEO|nr:hypothetical protein EK21DRAFT_92178 [Setomelanomma holmii]